MNEYEEILDIISEVQKNIQELFFSGFNSPSDFTLNELVRLSTILESCGMKYGSDKLRNIYDELQKKRHELKFNYKNLASEYCKLNQYCIICNKKLRVLNLKEKINCKG